MSFRAQQDKWRALLTDACVHHAARGSPADTPWRRFVRHKLFDRQLISCLAVMDHTQSRLGGALHDTRLIASGSNGVWLQSWHVQPGRFHCQLLGCGMQLPLDEMPMLTLYNMSRKHWVGIANDRLVQWKSATSLHPVAIQRSRTTHVNSKFLLLDPSSELLFLARTSLDKNIMFEMEVFHAPTLTWMRNFSIALSRSHSNACAMAVNSAKQWIVLLDTVKNALDVFDWWGRPVALVFVPVRYPYVSLAVHPTNGYMCVASNYHTMVVSPDLKILPFVTQAAGEICFNASGQVLFHWTPHCSMTVNITAWSEVLHLATHGPRLRRK